MGVGWNSFTREKVINIGVYSVGSQARGFFLHGILAPPPNLVQDYEQNGYGEKRGMIKLNRLSGHKMGETYGSGKRKSAEVFRKSARLRVSRERESAEGSENFVRIVALTVRVLGYLTVRVSQNSIFVQQCCLALSSPLALSFLIALASLRAVTSLLVVASLLVSTDLIQSSHSQTETNMRGERVRHKIESKEGKVCLISYLSYF